MNVPPLAQVQNDILEREAPAVLEMLSSVGKRFYFPKGILSQSAEAKAKGHRFNATIGIATEEGGPMHLSVFEKHLKGLEPRDVYPYAPPGGKPELRAAWKAKAERENPSLRTKATGMPIVTAALTHGISLISELFVDPGDKILLPNMLWGNYRLTFAVRQGGEVVTFPFFRDGRFDRAAFRTALAKLAESEKKALVVLNFPNNPSGFTPTREDAASMVESIGEAADRGLRQVVVSDDAYFGLIYDGEAMQESLFGSLAGVHPNVLAVRLDGATKEEFAWGFRVGFLTYAAGGDGDRAAVHDALEKKTTGLIRAGVSNCSHPAQTLVLKALEDPDFATQQAEKREILRARATRVREVLAAEKYAEAWTPYPFNSGYFMCVRVHGVDAEALRVRALNEYGAGTIATSATDLRVAFSCLELDQIEPLFDTLLDAWRDLSKPS